MMPMAGFAILFLCLLGEACDGAAEEVSDRRRRRGERGEAEAPGMDAWWQPEPAGLQGSGAGCQETIDLLRHSPVINRVWKYRRSAMEVFESKVPRGMERCTRSGDFMSLGQLSSGGGPAVTCSRGA